MLRRALPTPPLTPTWTYALVGGLASMPLTIGQYWLSGMGSHFSTGVILFGGLIAGYLAERNSTGAVRAGIGAGVVGGVPGYVWILPALVEFGTSFATAWSSPVAGAITMGFAGVMVIGVASLPGIPGGIVGAWLARNVGGRRAVHENA